MGLRPLACWDCGFESCRGHGCLSVVSVVCCFLRRADYSSRGIVQIVVSEYDREASDDEEALTYWGCCVMGKIKLIYKCI